METQPPDKPFSEMEVKERQHYEEAMTLPDLGALTDRYGIGPELQTQYESGISFATDKRRYIEHRIDLLEKSIGTRKSQVQIAENTMIDLGGYMSIGFDWAYNGHCATQDDFLTLTRNNLTIDRQVPFPKRWLVYCFLMTEIARGASTAFHVHFLKQELAKSPTPKSSTKPKNGLPVVVLEANDRLYLAAALEMMNSNERPDMHQIRSQLKDKLPRNYDPAKMNPRLLQFNHEEVTLLGIVTITGSEEVLNKCNRIMTSLQDILLSDGKIRKIDVADIAARAGLPAAEVGWLIPQANWYSRFVSHWGSRRTNFYGCDHVSVDDANYKAIMGFVDMKEVILRCLKNTHAPEVHNSYEVLGPAAKLTASVATQVLAMHYLLKKCELDPMDRPGPVSHLIQFLIGKEVGAKRIQNTSIYKKVAQPFKLKDTSLIKDLQTIRPYFEALDLTDIVQKIDREIQQSRAALDKKPSAARRRG